MLTLSSKLKIWWFHFVVLWSTTKNALKCVLHDYFDFLLLWRCLCLSRRHCKNSLFSRAWRGKWDWRKQVIGIFHASVKKKKKRSSCKDLAFRKWASPKKQNPQFWNGIRIYPTKRTERLNKIKRRGRIKEKGMASRYCQKSFNFLETRL